MIDLRREGSVFVLTLQAGENRLNRPFLDALNRAFDTVEASPGPAALVTVGEEKFYSTGLDLDWLGGAGQGEAPRFVNTVIALFARLVALDVPTVAAINGHAFAAGGMLAIAHDFRMMRADGGVVHHDVDVVGEPPDAQAILRLPAQPLHLGVDPRSRTISA